MQYQLLVGGRFSVDIDKVSLPVFNADFEEQKYIGVSFDHWFYYYDAYTKGRLTKIQLLHYWYSFRSEAPSYLMDRHNWGFISEHESSMTDLFRMTKSPLRSCLKSISEYSSVKKLKVLDIFDLSEDTRVNFKRYIESILEGIDMDFITSSDRVHYRESFTPISGFSKLSSALIILDSEFSDYSLSEEELSSRVYIYYKLYLDSRFNRIVSNKRLIVKEIFKINAPISIGLWKSLVLKYCRVGSTINLFINNCLDRRYPFEYLRFIWCNTPDIVYHHHIELGTGNTTIGTYTPKSSLNRLLVNTYGICYLALLR